MSYEHVDEFEVEEPVEQEVDICKLGRVTNCSKLNVRKFPEKNSEILLELLENSEVLVDEENSTLEFYKIFTVAGIDGFCVKKFIETVD